MSINGGQRKRTSSASRCGVLTDGSPAWPHCRGHGTGLGIGVGSLKRLAPGVDPAKGGCSQAAPALGDGNGPACRRPGASWWRLPSTSVRHRQAAGRATSGPEPARAAPRPQRSSAAGRGNRPCIPYPQLRRRTHLCPLIKLQFHRESAPAHDSRSTLPECAGQRQAWESDPNAWPAVAGGPFARRIPYSRQAETCVLL